MNRPYMVGVLIVLICGAACSSRPATDVDFEKGPYMVLNANGERVVRVQDSGRIAFEYQRDDGATTTAMMLVLPIWRTTRSVTGAPLTSAWSFCWASLTRPGLLSLSISVSMS